MSISEKIAAVRAAKTQKADYTGKKISEIDGDTVIGNAAALKKLFDANVEDVLDPKHNALAEATAAALEEVDTTKAADGHTHALTGDTLTGMLPVSKGGTGAQTPSTARTALDVYSKTETQSMAAGKVKEHDESADAHSNVFAKKTHTHTLSDITDYAGEKRKTWYATCAGGAAAVKTAVTATGDFSPEEGAHIIMEFASASYSSSVQYKIDSADAIEVIDRAGYEDGMISAGAIVTYIVVRETATGAYKLLKISEELATKSNVGVVKAMDDMTSTADYAVPTCAAAKKYVDEQAEVVKETYADGGNGNVRVRGVETPTTKAFLQGISFPGLSSEYREALHTGTYADPYGLKINSGVSLVDTINTLTEPGIYTLYINRTATDAPDEAKAISSSLRGMMCLSQIKKHYAWIVLIDQASNFYIQYVQGDVGAGWKRLAVYDDIKAYVDGKLDGVEEALAAI